MNNDDGNTTHDAESGLSKFKFFKAIVDERSRELCFEALRRADLVRWGIFVETMKETAAQMNADLLLPTDAWKSFAFKNASSKHVVYPTPTYELELNKMLIQHPLWR
ncbi:SusD family protein [compost metagenome]